MDWLDLLSVQGTLKSLPLHHSSKASIFQQSAFFTVQLSHPYMTTGKTIAMTNLGSILKSEDIMLQPKVCLVNAVVLPVVMYGCESWTITKAEHQRMDAFKL